MREHAAKNYRHKYPIEAMQWTNTAENRERFAQWFEHHGFLFETQDAELVLFEQMQAQDAGDILVAEGEWVVHIDGDFIAVINDYFNATFEEITP